MVDLVRFEADERGWYATGKRDQLIAAGACTAAHFEGRKRYKSGNDAATGRKWSLNAKRGGLWTFYLFRTNDERDVFRVQASRRKADKAEIEAMPNSKTEWRESVRRSFEPMQNALVYLLIEKTPGFALSADAVRKIEALLARVTMVVANADVEFDPDKRAAYINSVVREVDDTRPPVLRAPLRIVAATARA